MEYFIHLPMKMEPIVSSETSEIRNQTPGNYPKRNKLHLEHGESLKTRMPDSNYTRTIRCVQITANAASCVVCDIPLRYDSTITEFVSVKSILYLENKFFCFLLCSHRAH